MEERIYQILEKPITRILLVLPFVMWVVLYTSAPAFPLSSRPTIDVTTLYYFDVALLHYLPSTYLAELQNPFFDILGAIAYTLHAGWPFVFLAYMIFFKRRDLILPYWNCFGLVCFLGLITQLIMPTAPPWYYYKYGFEPASYDMKGDPAGLARVDERYNITFYKNMFDSSPVVFGSFPSLHIGWPSTLAFFCLLRDQASNCAEDSLDYLRRVRSPGGDVSAAPLCHRRDWWSAVCICGVSAAETQEDECRQSMGKIWKVL